MQKHPYKSLNDYSFWNRTVGVQHYSKFNPCTNLGINIKKATKVATAGSCFAQHIAKNLSKNGFNYYIAEPAHSIIPEQLAAEYNYGTFSCRYGNLYTVKQLLQLFKQAFYNLEPIETHWKKDKYYIDPYRPNIQPNGYNSLEELKKDRQYHLHCVREMFKNLDVFIFTMGLTEAWIDKRDGMVFPICPGIAGGTFDEDLYKFHNFTYEETLQDIEEFRALLLKKNPSAQILLTVSPVPLMATAEDRHVVTSTTVSKSILRVVADVISKKYEDVFYFPSYEIISSHYNRGVYYEPDLRGVTEKGVAHVMGVFLENCTDFQSDTTNQNNTPIKKPHTKASYLEEIEEASQVICDEELLDI